MWIHRVTVLGLFTAALHSALFLLLFYSFSPKSPSYLGAISVTFWQFFFSLCCLLGFSSKSSLTQMQKAENTELVASANRGALGEPCWRSLLGFHVLLELCCTSLHLL